MAQFNFDPNQHKIQETMEALPPGWYPAVMIESDIIETAKKDGFRLSVVFQITDGPGAGRKIKNGYNIANQSTQAVEISMNEIKTMQVCMGIFVPIQDSQEMHNRPLQIKLIKQKDSDFNEVKGYKTINGVDAKDAANSGAVAGPPVGHQAQPPQGFGQPPAPPAPPYTVDPTAGWQRQNGHRLNPATNAWELDTPAAPAAPPAPPAPAAAPSWAPSAPPAATPPSYAPPAPAAGAPSWAPQTSGQVVAPSWAPPK